MQMDRALGAVAGLLVALGRRVVAVAAGRTVPPMPRRGGQNGPCGACSVRLQLRFIRGLKRRGRAPGHRRADRHIVIV